MRCIYTVPFAGEILIPDHWGVPLLGGLCRVVEGANGRAKALEITFSGQPTSQAPKIERVFQGRVKAHITGRDLLLPLVKRRLEDAKAFLECFHTLDLRTSEIGARYEAETPDEAAEIAIPSFGVGRAKHPLPLSFDMITRALMAAETKDGPHFQATLTNAAREMLGEQRFIDSFRYSFLLVEALFGEGQFKKASLQAALKGNPSFATIVRSAMTSGIKPRQHDGSETTELLKRGASADEVIDHLVEMRGFYFHGNIKRRDAWKPDRKQEAEALACLAISIAQEIAQESAAPIFVPEFAQRHFDDAVKAGATIVFEIQFQFREPGETFPRKDVLEIRTPGTKVTTKQANYIAQEFFRRFEHGSPVGGLESAVCVVKGSGQRVFELSFFAGDDNPQSVGPQDEAPRAP